MADIPVHDPYVWTDKKNGVYYMYTSGIPRLTDLDRHGVLVYKSTDLLDWEGPFVVFTFPDNVWAHPQHGTWAPEVRIPSIVSMLRTGASFTAQMAVVSSCFGPATTKTVMFRRSHDYEIEEITDRLKVLRARRSSRKLMA